MQSQKVIKCPQYKCVLSKLTSIFTRANGPSTCHSIGSNTYLMFIGLRFSFRMLPNNVSQQSNFSQYCQNTHIQSFYILKSCTMCTVHMLNISYASSKLFLILTVFLYDATLTHSSERPVYETNEFGMKFMQSINDMLKQICENIDFDKAFGNRGLWC